MNTPPFKALQLSPNLSSMAFCLDDPSNNEKLSNNSMNSFQHLLASPTKLKLDNSSLFYRTSLSKLNDYSSSSKNATPVGRERRNSDTLNPIRFQFSNSSNAQTTNTPKMLKPEFLSQKASANALPLLSALMGSNGNTNNSNSNSNIKKTLEQLQQQIETFKGTKPTASAAGANKENVNPNLLNAVPIVPVKKNVPTPSAPAPAPIVAQPLFESNMPVHQHHPHPHPHTHPRKQSPQERYLHNDNTRVSSSSTTVYTPMSSMAQTPILDEPSPIVLENPPSNNYRRSQQFELDDELDMNGFVSNKGNNFKNRYSFISSTSTDFDMDWYDQPTPPNVNQRRPSPTQLHHSQRNVGILEENQQVDLKIKKLELEINELKLQNEKLINSISKNKVMEDKILFELISEKHNNEKRSKKKKEEDPLEKKLKQMEKKFKTYQKLLQNLTQTNNTTSTSRMSSNCSNSSKTRIPRISRKELKRIEEQNDSTSASDFNDNLDTSSEDEKELNVTREQLEAFHYNARDADSVHTQGEEEEGEDYDDDDIHSKRLTPSSLSSGKTGFQLNFQVQPVLPTDEH
ncbi:hypothetical protein NCAS_0E02780 [Naumovozyma castellii]|uniref:Uncharacterized protein n=1 Tax=Naumovozyma castellii TaxID=27288 RepID=G0VFT1_NAUCA|nr:hypothetical protein NCAS_0E02780 [Naumovozyma castellii CBS 4309]CCC70348.1 hypothetical protein NCAS_0E02780 [Naumovozyma castellii CBS 4309]